MASVAQPSAAEKVDMALMALKSVAVKVATAAMVVSVVQLSMQEKIALVDHNSMKVNSVQSAAHPLVVLVRLAHLLMVQDLAQT